MRVDEMVVSQVDIMEEVYKDAVIVQEGASAVRIWEAGYRNARVVHRFIMEDIVILIDYDVINLLFLSSLLLIKDSQLPDAIIHINYAILITV